ncbi:hypothetical protein RM780_20925 [Streptomyces sp. DSM 44917]|uniref:Uncharacterized protein n=1 Tax=Streptomyces boetiae TaxID=3075541 RepID=A0ABU2LCV0_9ACTN|nr:hypothetical protein [Streptomyces sp. DSM 44917]MDT0309404.1 hypothetical protein [Streptomyces sp. DSM 44917]
MPDAATLEAAVDAAADRLRRLPESRLRRGAATAGLDLARELARRAQLLENPAAPPRELPDDGVFVTGDQLAVAGHDLAHAIRHAPDPAAARAALTTALALLSSATDF